MKLKIPFDIAVPRNTSPLYTYPPHLFANKTEALKQFLLRDRKQKTFTIAITGAGISTDSGIPDYRGPQGTYTVHKDYRPIFYQEYLEENEKRKRYWARGFLGWNNISKALKTIRDTPKDDLKALKSGRVHAGVQWLREQGLVDLVVTQNVDMLHGDDSGIIDMHGTLSQVECLTCGHVEDREVLQEQLKKMNEQSGSDIGWNDLLEVIEKATEDKIEKIATGVPEASEKSLKDQYHEFLFSNDKFADLKPDSSENTGRERRTTEESDIRLDKDMKYDLNIALVNELKAKGNIRINPDGDLDPSTLAQFQKTLYASDKAGGEHSNPTLPDYSSFKYPACSKCASKGLVSIDENGAWIDGKPSYVHYTRQPRVLEILQKQLSEDLIEAIEDENGRFVELDSLLQVTTIEKEGALAGMKLQFRDREWNIPHESLLMVKSGILKPRVVFFGEQLPFETKLRIQGVTVHCKDYDQVKVLVMGTSLATYSSYGLVRRLVGIDGNANDNIRSMAVVNLGFIRGEDNFYDHFKQHNGQFIRIRDDAGKVLIDSIMKMKSE